MFRRLVIAVCLAVVVSAGAEAADSVAAAGRIENRATGGSCSASLITGGIVATAAHCTMSITEADGDGTVVFIPGNGADAVAVTRAFRHPLYDPDSPRIDWKFRFDIAVAELSDGGRLDGIEPFPLGGDAQTGETLYIVSWRKGEGTQPRQRACPVLSVGLPGVVTLGCPVRGGESGAPVLRKTDHGLELVAIISSRTRLLDQPVAQASNVRLRLPPLLDMVRGASGS